MKESCRKLASYMFGAGVFSSFALGILNGFIFSSVVSELRSWPLIDGFLLTAIMLFPWAVMGLTGVYLFFRAHHLKRECPELYS